MAVAFFCACALLTKHGPGSANDTSRIAAIESLVDRGTWQIDQSPWVADTIDKVYLGGRFYSDKMPLLNLVGAGVYRALRWGRGASLANDCGDGRPCAYYSLTLLLVGLPAAGLVWLFFDVLIRQQVNGGVAALATAACVLGAMVWPYSLVLNHHLPSAFVLFASFYLLMTNGNRFGLLVAGFCAGLAISFDLISAIVCVSLIAIAFVRTRRGVVYFALGALVPLLVTGMLDYQITGTVFPPYLINRAYAYPGSTLPPAGNGPPANAQQYAFDMLVGAHGLYAYAPVLLFAVAGLARVVLTRGHALRQEAACLGAGYLALTMYLMTRTFNFGGFAYGERYYVHAIPLVMIFVVFATPFTHTRWRSALGVIFAGLLAISVLSGYQGGRHPWRYSPPLVHLTRNPETGAIGWRHQGL